ncbi:hypothetical protein NO365_04415 (plasmid) [Planktothrix agardhii]|nr:hypothetical protein NO365_04415 [Planktothrix agardhii]
MELWNWAGVIAISTASHTVEVLIDGLGWHRRSEYMIEVGEILRTVTYSSELLHRELIL